MQAPQIDREEMAHIISSLTVQLPNIQDASALVTDEEALVVYKRTPGSANRRLIKSKDGGIRRSEILPYLYFR
ncbi:YhcN/YlaJ family sporulation lipoprotein [Bacillus licheniformis]|nr:YhcN/YlaJ family sporulation lipoprotein [Bacillus licheniformis]